MVIEAHRRLKAEGEVEADIQALVGEMAGGHAHQQGGDVAARGDDSAETGGGGIGGVVMQRVAVAGRPGEAAIEPIGRAIVRFENNLGKPIAVRFNNLAAAVGRTAVEKARVVRCGVDSCPGRGARP
jgi:hypothetical protein